MDLPSLSQTRSSRRASEKGLLPVSLEEYLAMLDWTGRQARHHKRGSIPAGLAPILERLNIQPNEWTSAVNEFGKWACRVVGTPEQMQAAAEAAGRMWYQGINRCRRFFQPPPPDE